MIVDSHVHIFSEAVRSDPGRYFALDAYFGELYRPGRVRLASTEELIAEMDGAGVDVAVAVGWGWRELALCREENDYVLDAMQRYPGRIVGLASVSPTSRGASQEVERCLAAGMRGAGELMPDGQGFRLDDPRALRELAEVLRAHDAVLLTHASEPLGHVYPGKGTATPDVLARFLAQQVDLRVILAHWGGGLPFYELMPEIAAAAANAVYDSAASPYLYDWSVFRHVAALVGVPRVLFGSDYPVTRPGRTIRRLRELGFDAAELAAMLGGNAARVFRLGREGVPLVDGRDTIGP